MAWDDTGDPNAQDWFEQNAPRSDPFADQVNALYQKYYHTDAPPEAIQAHRGNTGGLPAIEKMLKDSLPPTQAPSTPTPTTPDKPTGSSGAPTLNRHDPASVSAYVSYYANQPGANPSLKRDPGYWIGKISSGELGDDPNYIVSKFMAPEGAPAGSGRGMAREPGGGFSIAGGQPDYVTPPPTYASNPAAPPPPAAPVPLSPYVAPTWSGGSPPTRTALTPYTPPTQEQLQASPGYKERYRLAMDASQASAAAKGSILSGGYQKELTRDISDYASNEYANLFGQGLAANQNNNAVTNTGNIGNYQDYVTRYGQFTDTANMGMSARQQNVGENLTNYNQGQQGYTSRYGQYLDANSRTLQDYLINLTAKRNQGNDYWSHLNDLYQTGANAATGSYRPGIGTT